MEIGQLYPRLGLGSSGSVSHVLQCKRVESTQVPIDQLHSETTTILRILGGVIVLHYNFPCPEDLFPFRRISIVNHTGVLEGVSCLMRFMLKIWSWHISGLKFNSKPGVQVRGLERSLTWIVFYRLVCMFIKQGIRRVKCLVFPIRFCWNRGVIKWLIGFLPSCKTNRLDVSR